MIDQPAPLGSSLYYSLRRLPSPKRQAFLMVQAYADELRRISEHYHNAEVATVKLGWWREEVALLYSGEPRHPITLALQPLLEQYQIRQSLLTALVEAAETTVATHLFPTQAELTQHLQHTGGIVTSIQAQILSGKALEQYAHTLGVALEIMRHLAELPYHFQRQHMYLPLDAVEASSLAMERLCQVASHPDQRLSSDESQLWCALIQQQIDLARQTHQQALALLPDDERAAQWPLRCYAALQLQWLKLIEQHRETLLHEQWHISPIRKLWLTWWFR